MSKSNQIHYIIFHKKLQAISKKILKIILDKHKIPKIFTLIFIPDALI